MRRVALLLALVAALGLGLWFVVRQEREGARQQRAAARVFNLDDQQIRRLSLLRGEKRWDFRYDDDAARWRMMAPRGDLASGEQVGNLIFLLGQAIVERTIESPEGLSAYGLDPPVITVIVGDDERWRVDIGTPTPTGDGLFARVADRDGVLVLSDYARQSFLGRPDPNRLREAALFDLLKSEIVRIEFRGREGFTLQRGGDGWWLSSPRRLPAADSQVNTLLEVLEETEVQAFLDDVDPALDGEPLLDLRLASAGEAREIRFGRAGGKHVAIVEGRETVLEVDGARIESIPAAVDPFLSRRLTKVNRYNVTAFEFNGPDGAWAANRKDEGWTDAAGAAIDEGRVLAFLAAILGARTEGWRVGGGDGEAVAKLGYTLEDGATGTVTFVGGNEAVWSAVPDASFAVRGGVPSIPVDGP